LCIPRRAPTVRHVLAIAGNAWYPRVQEKSMNRTLVVIGIVLVLAGLFWKQLTALPLFRLPGDLVIDRPGLKFFFPITTMIVISLVVSLILWLFRR
jgi:hypothetical protein